METGIQLVQKTLASVQTDFEKTNRDALDFSVEARFALQIFDANSFLQSVAQRDPASLKAALRNVSMVGLTLSPVLGLAYLIPRKGKICLDISYKGMITMLYRFGAVQSISAELVYQGEEFDYRPSEANPVTHRANPFGDRGAVLGGYARALLPNGCLLYAVMSADEVEKIKQRSESVKAGKSSPWDTDEAEMTKKTLIRRLFKIIPKTFVNAANFERVNAVMELDAESGKLATPDEQPKKGGALDEFLNVMEDGEYEDVSGQAALEAGPTPATN